MSTERVANNFDADAVAAALFGTWRFPLINEAAVASIGLLHFTDTGRAIQFVFNPQQPERRIPMRLWYSIESPTHLRFRPEPDHDGWFRGYRLDGSTMILLAEDLRFICTRPLPEELPDWFSQSLASELARP